MSKVSISGNASGTGVFTIQAPNSNVDRVLSLPDEAGTIITTAGVPASAMPAGSVIQVVSNFITSAFSTTSATPVATGLSATITPSSSSSKILILCAGGWTNVTSNGQGHCYIYRNGVVISNNPGGYFFTNTGQVQSAVALSSLDAPASTASLTYSLYAASENGGQTIQVGAASTAALHLTLMEIAG